MISSSASHITTACSQLITTRTAHTGPVAQVRYPKSRDRSAPPASTPIAFAYTSGTGLGLDSAAITHVYRVDPTKVAGNTLIARSEEHTSELQSLRHLVCRLLLEKKK